MPRKSPEARAAGLQRNTAKYPTAPPGLGPDARRVWREIVASRAPDVFAVGGALHLLEQLCVATAVARHWAQQVMVDPTNREAAGIYMQLMQRCAMHCQKLRLTVQTEVVDPRAGVLAEREPVPQGKDDTLFGGNVVRF